MEKGRGARETGEQDRLRSERGRATREREQDRQRSKRERVR